MKILLSRITRTSHQTRRWGALAVLITGLLGGSMAMPAAAHDSEPLDYVAFGDSYTAGIGAGLPQLSDLYTREQCFQASPGYPDVLDDRRGVRLVANAACGGSNATTVPFQVQVASDAGKLNPRTDLVTITAGGNDVNFGGILGACRSSLDACKAAVASAEARAETEVLASLKDAYSAIRAVGPQATIVAIGYPHLFSPEFEGELFLTDEAAEVFNDGTDTLNKVMRKAAKQVRGTVYVDVSDEFEGHGIGSPYPWIIFNGDLSDSANFHPNATGYAKGYYRAVASEVRIGN